MIIHIHISKTGGISFRRSLSTKSKNGPNRHRRVIMDGKEIKMLSAHNNIERHFKRHGKKIFDESIRVSVIRNPYDRMVSLWHYAIQIKGKDLPEFNKWIKELYDQRDYLNNPKLHKGIPNLTTKPQFYWCSLNGELALTDIIKFENYKEDFEAFVDKYNIEASPLKHVNRSKHNHFMSYYNEDTRRMTYEIYKIDFEQFNYKFI